jgi:hypothetical protein
MSDLTQATVCIHEKLVHHNIRLLTEFCVNSRFQQIKGRLGLPPTMDWEDARTNNQFGKQITGAVLRILRMAGFLKYVMLYPNFQNSRLDTLKPRKIYFRPNPED